MFFLCISNSKLFRFSYIQVPYSTAKLVDAPPPFNSTANLTNGWEKSCNHRFYHLLSNIDAISALTDQLWSQISDNKQNLAGLQSS